MRTQRAARGLALVAVLAVAAWTIAGGQRPAEALANGNTTDGPPPVRREFRGVWVATVGNIDWPSKAGLSTAEQQAELLAIMDRSAALKLNAVIFQVRTGADALYQSDIEPWSEYLTGVQGQAPRPLWDPLEFAVREAHARGLELHAWFNPYRARYNVSKGQLAATHIGRTNPAVVKQYGQYLWMDPGEPTVRQRTLGVVLDVVKRYDIDGVHIDDYFYPYPVAQPRGRGELPFPDDNSYARYRTRGGTLSRDDWRRDNVNTLVRELHEAIRAEKPWVKFGISPFGIWRPGTPVGVVGFDAYAKLYADARLWMHEGWADYFTPQLYWPTYKQGQKYALLLDWWAQENRRGRHMWPGNFTSRAGGRGAGSFSVQELLEQIRVTRAHETADGNVHFSMKSFITNQAGMNDTLLSGPYAEPALVPPSPWMQAPPPPTPQIALGRDRNGVREARLATLSGDAPYLWIVRARYEDGWTSVILPGSRDRWSARAGSDPLEVHVSTVNRIGIEGRP